jgi:hypothetical protein
MKSPLGKFGLFIVAVVLSFFTASYVGTWYNQITPQYGNFVIGSNDAMLFAGWLMSFGFFVPFIFSLFGFKENKNWITVLLIIPALLWLSSDPYHIYIPVIFGLVAFALAKLIRFIISKLKRPNPPMVVK